MKNRASGFLCSGNVYPRVVRVRKVRGITFIGEGLGLRRRRRKWLTAISSGDPYAGVEPGISECDFALETERSGNAGN